jgi:hypothetical protein
MKRPPRLSWVGLGFLWLGVACSGSGGSGDASTGGDGSGAGRSGGAGTTGAAGGGGSAGRGAGGGGAGGAAGATGAGGTAGAAGGGGGASGGTGGGGRGGSGGGAAGAGGTGGTATACPTANEDKFSFFLISNKALIREGGADSTGMFSKLGGNLGGLTGADGLCQRVAQFVSPCQSSKVWHAFLSTSTVNAIDRIGTGPWYDRNGRLWSANLTNLVAGDRPSDADPAIRNDAPNEDGVPNHNPDGTGNVDNHETLTGSGTNGRVYNQTVAAMGTTASTQCQADVGGTGSGWSVDRATCWGWTRNTAEGCPRVGHSWPAQGSGNNWLSVWNEGGCAPGGSLVQTGGLDGTRKVGSAGGYGGFYCFAVRP